MREIGKSIITREDVEAEIAAYENQYGMTTETLLRLIKEDSELADFPDAGFWRSSHELFQRMVKYDSSR